MHIYDQIHFPSILPAFWCWHISKPLPDIMCCSSTRLAQKPPGHKLQRQFLIGSNQERWDPVCSPEGPVPSSRGQFIWYRLAGCVQHTGLNNQIGSKHQIKVPYIGHILRTPHALCFWTRQCLSLENLTYKLAKTRRHYCTFRNGELQTMII